MPAVKISFRPLRKADLPLLHRWFNTPHVSQWWSVSGQYHPSLKIVKDKYLPRILGKDPVDGFLILLNEKPIGMVQSYQFDDFPAEKAEFGLDDRFAGMDIMIGEADYVHKGQGSGIIRAFLKGVLFKKYEVDYCVVDPYVENEIAIKAYKKAGFKYLKTEFNKKDNRQEDILIISRVQLMAQKE